MSSENASSEYVGEADFIEAGEGPMVVLVHASLAGARQWSDLIRDLQDRFRIRAVNLFGYGGTPAWTSDKRAKLDDFATLVSRVVPATERKVHLVGHSVGGAVAMHLAAHQLRGRVERLVLMEPSLFYLLEQNGQRAAFREISGLASFTNHSMAAGAAEEAAKRFMDYWCGPFTWAAMRDHKKSTLLNLMPGLVHEWDAVLPSGITAAEWAALLPRHTLLMLSARAQRPSRGIVQALWRHAGPNWELTNIPQAGHMAPLTHPQIVNPIVRGFLADVPIVPAWSRRTDRSVAALHNPHTAPSLAGQGAGRN